MAMIQVRVDENLKSKSVSICQKIGIDLSTAIRMFLMKMVVEGGIPFDTKIDETTLKAILAIEHMNRISEQNGNSEMTLDEINEIIRQVRIEMKNNKS